jgi:HNH endonuclease
MRKVDYPTPFYLRQCFTYDDGRIFWKVRPLEHFKDRSTYNKINGKHACKEAGSLNESLHYGPRWQVGVNGIITYRSTIVWYLFNDKIIPPELEVEHEDRNKLNDRIENLRLATSLQNKQNKTVKKNKKLGLPKGVCITKCGTYYSQIVVNGVFTYLGMSDTPEEAHRKYVEAAKKYFGEFASDGKPVEEQKEEEDK